MKRAQALAALQAAITDRFTGLFAVLWRGLLSHDEPPEELVKRFELGFLMLLKAHTLAETTIERMIPADKSDPAS